MKLSEMLNIGPRLEKMLNNVDIHNSDELIEVGSVEAIKRLNIEDNACFNKLYALEGAIRGMRWHDLTNEDKEQLKMQYKS